eukprot:1111285-Alexandrium_andersonii.AAC.1
MPGVLRQYAAELRGGAEAEVPKDPVDAPAPMVVEVLEDAQDAEVMKLHSLAEDLRARGFEAEAARVDA